MKAGARLGLFCAALILPVYAFGQENVRDDHCGGSARAEERLLRIGAGIDF